MFAYLIKRLAKHGLDVALHGRGMLLTNGNAPVARLYRSARDLSIPVWLDSPAKRLIVEDGGAVTAAVVQTPQGLKRVVARKGVVLARGGFPQDVARRQQLYSHSAGPSEHHSAASPANVGDGIRLGEAVGARVVEDYPNAAAWAPVSLVPRKDGSKGPFPRFH